MAETFQRLSLNDHEASAIRVFRIPELADQILILLTARQLITLKRVCRTLCRVVRRSPVLQSELFSNRAGAVSRLQGKLYGKRRSGRKELWRELRVNQAVFELVSEQILCGSHTPRWTYRHRERIHSPITRLSLRPKTVCPRLSIRLDSEQDVLDATENCQASWAAMYLTQPPIPTALHVYGEQSDGVTISTFAADLLVFPATLGQLIKVAIVVKQNLRNAQPTSKRLYPRMRWTWTGGVEGAGTEGTLRFFQVAEVLPLLLTRPHYNTYVGRIPPISAFDDGCGGSTFDPDLFSSGGW